MRIGLKKKLSPRQRTPAKGIALLGQELFKDKMRDLGYHCADRHQHNLHDFFVNGHRVEIKTSSLGHKDKWCFDFTKNVGHFDILVCCGEYKEKVWWLIIPLEALKNHVSVGVMPFSDSRGWEKWSAYLDNWEILESRM